MCLVQVVRKYFISDKKYLLIKVFPGQTECDTNCSESSSATVKTESSGEVKKHLFSDAETNTVSSSGKFREQSVSCLVLVTLHHAWRRHVSFVNTVDPQSIFVTDKNMQTLLVLSRKPCLCHYLLFYHFFNINMERKYILTRVQTVYCTVLICRLVLVKLLLVK